MGAAGFEPVTSTVCGIPIRLGRHDFTRGVAALQALRVDTPACANVGSFPHMGGRCGERFPTIATPSSSTLWQVNCGLVATFPVHEADSAPIGIELDSEFP